MDFCLKQLLFNNFYFKLFIQSSVSSGQYCRMAVPYFLQVMTSQEISLLFSMCMLFSSLRALLCRITLMGSAI